MKHRTIVRWIVRTMEFIFAATFVGALGAAGYALLCGVLYRAVDGGSAPVFEVGQSLAAGVLAGFIVGIVAALDRALSWNETPAPLWSEEKSPTSRPSEKRTDPQVPAIPALPSFARQTGMAARGERDRTR